MTSIDTVLPAGIMIRSSPPSYEPHDQVARFDQLSDTTALKIAALATSLL